MQKKFSPEDFYVDKDGSEWSKFRDSASPRVTPQYPLPKQTPSQLVQWNDERKFIEGILYTRYGHMLTLAGAVTAGLGAFHEKQYVLERLAILGLGVVMGYFQMQATTRAYAKAQFLGASLSKYNYAPVAVTDTFFDKDREIGRFRGKEAMVQVGRYAPKVLLGLGVIALALQLLFFYGQIWSSLVSLWNHAGVAVKSHS